MRDGVGVRVSGAFGGHSGAGMWPSSGDTRAAPVSWRWWVAEFINCIQHFEAHGRAREAHGVRARRQVGETMAYLCIVQGVLTIVYKWRNGRSRPWLPRPALPQPTVPVGRA